MVYVLIQQVVSPFNDIQSVYAPYPDTSKIYYSYPLGFAVNRGLIRFTPALGQYMLPL